MTEPAAVSGAEASRAPLAPVPHGRPRRLVYLGTPEMAVPALQALVDGGFDVALVVTRADTRRGRGSETSPSAVKIAALELGVPVAHDVEAVLDVGADLGVVVAYGRLIRRPVLERLAMVNVHFSLLPRWRGAAPVERALLAGDTTTGVCLMQLEEGLDTGPVFAHVDVAIDARATVASLRTTLVERGTTLLVEQLSAGLGRPLAQQGEPTYAAKLDPAELHIDWQRPAAEIDRVVRVGGAWTTFRGKRLRVIDALPCAASLDAGVIDASAGDGVLVGASVGSVELRTVQAEGKAPMPVGAWRNGAQPKAGERFGG